MLSRSHRYATPCSFAFDLGYYEDLFDQRLYAAIASPEPDDTLALEHVLAKLFNVVRDGTQSSLDVDPDRLAAISELTKETRRLIREWLLSADHQELIDRHRNDHDPDPHALDAQECAYTPRVDRWMFTLLPNTPFEFLLDRWGSPIAQLLSDLPGEDTRFFYDAGASVAWVECRLRQRDLPIQRLRLSAESTIRELYGLASKQGVHLRDPVVEGGDDDSPPDQPPPGDADALAEWFLERCRSFGERMAIPRFLEGLIEDRRPYLFVNMTTGKTTLLGVPVDNLQPCQRRLLHCLWHDVAGGGVTVDQIADVVRTAKLSGDKRNPNRVVEYLSRTRKVLRAALARAELKEEEREHMERWVSELGRKPRGQAVFVAIPRADAQFIGAPDSPIA